MADWCSYKILVGLVQLGNRNLVPAAGRTLVLVLSTVLISCLAHKAVLIGKCCSRGKRGDIGVVLWWMEQTLEG